MVSIFLHWRLVEQNYVFLETFQTKIKKTSDLLSFHQTLHLSSQPTRHFASQSHLPYLRSTSTIFSRTKVWIPSSDDPMAFHFQPESRLPNKQFLPCPYLVSDRFHQRSPFPRLLDCWSRTPSMLIYVLWRLERERYRCRVHVLVLLVRYKDGDLAWEIRSTKLWRLKISSY